MPLVAMAVTHSTALETSRHMQVHLCTTVAGVVSLGALLFVPEIESKF